MTFKNDVNSRVISLAPTVSNKITTTNQSKPKYTLTQTQVIKNVDGNLVWVAIDITVGCLIEN